MSNVDRETETISRSSNSVESFDHLAKKFPGIRGCYELESKSLVIVSHETEYFINFQINISHHIMVNDINKIPANASADENRLKTIKKNHCQDHLCASDTGRRTIYGGAKDVSTFQI